MTFWKDKWACRRLDGYTVVCDNVWLGVVSKKKKFQLLSGRDL